MYFLRDNDTDDVTEWRWNRLSFLYKSRDIFHDNSKTNHNIILKHRVRLYHVHLTNPVNIGVDVVNNDFISFKTKSKLLSAVTS